MHHSKTTSQKDDTGRLVRSSPRLHSALLRSRLFGPILTDWQVRGGVRREVTFKAISVVVIAVAITIFLSRFSMIPTVTVALLAIVGIGVIVRLPTARQPQPGRVDLHPG